MRRFQNGLHLCPHSGVGNIPTFPQRIAHNVSHVEGGSFSSEATVASDLPSDFYKYVNSSIILPVDFVAIAFAVWYDEVRQAG